MSAPIPGAEDPQASLASSLHILIVEDMEAMAGAIGEKVAKLHEWFPAARITTTSTWADALNVINAEPPPDGTLLDLSLPDSAMHDTISRVEMLATRTAVVIITGHSKEKVLALLKDKDTPILEKTPQLFRGDSILLTIIRAIDSRRRSASMRRFAHMDEILGKLKEMQDAPTPQR